MLCQKEGVASGSSTSNESTNDMAPGHTTTGSDRAAKYRDARGGAAATNADSNLCSHSRTCPI